ncbi:SubName: Full=Uncharacterized protein {ECO:0000313/EMBL:CCA71894.1} [Serendipita indica DSM 11827]|nr:SubName: Full=Uncharacterized protein {ECO:0000313/EMBL:CCA71894.1} [Serendipita indica DSM 11827]
MAPGAQKNLWVAASDGDLTRVKYFIEEEGMSPNAPDQNTYTPMHAAASYGHIELLEYLISKGGDVNVEDEDGDTPLYTAESLDVAKWLVDHGAIINRVNNEGISVRSHLSNFDLHHISHNTQPAQHLLDDYPAIAHYLSPELAQTGEEEDVEGPSEYAQEQLSEELTNRMMKAVEEIMARAAAEGRDPEDELAALVEKTVLESLDAGEGLVEAEQVATPSLEEPTVPSKRKHTEE